VILRSLRIAGAAIKIHLHTILKGIRTFHKVEPNKYVTDISFLFTEKGFFGKYIGQLVGHP